MTSWAGQSDVLPGCREAVIGWLRFGEGPPVVLLEAVSIVVVRAEHGGCEERGQGGNSQPDQGEPLVSLAATVRRWIHRSHAVTHDHYRNHPADALRELGLTG
ncbi:hypothetical protein StrepF001_22360 [Streptomyces sp. F001]|nr:hypothetical protein StrepF001_22360 [Streptomyces sp. F001]